MNSKAFRRASPVLLMLLALGGGCSDKAKEADRPDDTAHYVIMQPRSGMSETTLRQAIAPLFDSAVGETQAVVVLDHGVVVAERYGEGITRETRLLSRSIAKTLTTVLVGLMVSDGRLALDSPVPLPRWDRPGDPRGSITLRHLLTMSSGLDHREAGEPLATADTVRMLFTDGSGDMADFAEGKPIADRPGAHFRYSTADTMIVADLMTRMLTPRDDPAARRAAMEEFVRGRLADPARLRSLTVDYDARGTMIGGAMMYMTARDYARFGKFLLNDGRMDGRQLLSPRWVDFMRTPSRANPAYGGGVWIDSSEGGPLFDGRGPKGLFASVGRNGQYILISPRQRLVVVRMGVTPEKKIAALTEALENLLDIFPAG